MDSSVVRNTVEGRQSDWRLFSPVILLKNITKSFLQFSFTDRQHFLSNPTCTERNI